MYKKYFKRFLDVLVSGALLIVISPIIFIVALLLMTVNKGNPFFFQTRPGKAQRPFKIIKFKSMTDEKDKNGNLLPDNMRITKIGQLVRKTSIDELPQLINVLLGDMSLIGPRPLLYKYIPLYNKDQLRRHLVRPGITGLAQVRGRNSISWNKKFAYDIEYVDNLTFFTDLKILFLTIKKVLIKEGINQSDNRPMEPFNGSN